MSPATLLEVIASALENTPERMKARHLAQPARDLAATFPKVTTHDAFQEER